MIRWPWRSWKWNPAPQFEEPEEEQEPAAGHHHLLIEHGDVETDSSSSEHWPVLPVEEAVHVEDPAGEQTCSAAEEAMAPTEEPVAWVMEEEEGTGSDTDGEEADAGNAGGGGRGRRRRGVGRRRMRRGGHPVRMVVGTAAVMLLALVALVASWRRRQRRRGRPAAPG